MGHADGDLDLVVGRFDPGVGMAEPDGCEDVVAASADLPAWFDDLGDAAAGRPADPSFEFRFGPFDGLAQEFPELPRAVAGPWDPRRRVWRGPWIGVRSGRRGSRARRI